MESFPDTVAILSADFSARTGSDNVVLLATCQGFIPEDTLFSLMTSWSSKHSFNRAGLIIFGSFYERNLVYSMDIQILILKEFLHFLMLGGKCY